MAKQEIPFYVYIKGPLAIGKDLVGLDETAVPATLYVKQPGDDASKELARIANGTDSGLTIALIDGVLHLQSLPVNGVPGALAVNQAGGQLQLGGAGSQVSIPGSLTVNGVDLLVGLKDKLPLSGGILTGALKVESDLTVTGKINERDLAEDAKRLDAHLQEKNPHKLTAADLGVLPTTGGTLTGALTVQSDLTVTGAVNGRNLVEDGKNLDAHLKAKNPHNLTPGDLSALPTTGGTLTGALKVESDLTVTGKINERNLAEDAKRLDAHLQEKNPHKLTAADLGVLPTTGGTLTGALTVQGALTVTGKLNGRDLFNELDSKLANKDSTVTGSLTVTERLMVNGTDILEELIELKKQVTGLEKKPLLPPYTRTQPEDDKTDDMADIIGINTGMEITKTGREFDFGDPHKIAPFDQDTIREHSVTTPAEFLEPGEVSATPFVLATPHHTTAWVRSHPGLLQSELASRLQELTQQAVRIQELEQAQTTEPLNAEQVQQLATLQQSYATLLAEYQSLAQGGAK